MLGVIACRKGAASAHGQLLRSPHRLVARSGVNGLASPTRVAPGSMPWALAGAHAQGPSAMPFSLPSIPSTLHAAGRRLSLAMTMPRKFHIAGVPLTTNLSDMCGHGSFMALAAAYMESDVLALRGYAVGGVVLSVLFQYYRPQPLWLPISWNGVFLIINLVMIALLLDERRGAANLDAEQRAVFEGVFARLGLSPVDFMKLVRLADRRVLSANCAPLATEGREQEEMFMIVQGAAEVLKEGDHVADLKPLQFVGSMAFLRFFHSGEAEAADAAEAAGAESGRGHFVAEAAAAVLAEDASDIAMQRITEAVASARLAHSTMDAAARSRRDSAIESAGHNTAPASSGGGQQQQQLSTMQAALPPQQLERHSSGDLVPLGKQQQQRQGGSAGSNCSERLSTTTVCAVSEMTVYAWDFHLLRAYLRRHPEAAAAFQTSVSADLTRKVDQSRHSGERYRVLLHNVLSYGEVTPLEKKKLQRFRSLHGITPSEHLKLLGEAGWTPQEFDMGLSFRSDGPGGSKLSSKFTEYDRAVAAAIAGRDEVSPAARAALRRQRAAAGVDPEEHILALGHYGWSPDEWEEGCRSSKNRSSSTSRKPTTSGQNTHNRQLPRRAVTGAVSSSALPCSER